MKKILGTLLAVLFSFMAINDSAAPKYRFAI